MQPGVQTDHKHTYTLYMKYYLEVKHKGYGMMQKCEVILVTFKLHIFLQFYPQNFSVSSNYIIWMGTKFLMFQAQYTTHRYITGMKKKIRSCKLIYSELDQQTC